MEVITKWGLIGLMLGMLGACSSADDGMLKISSDPYDAEVYIDGELKGNTPAKKGQTYAIKLAEGDYTIEIIKPIENPEKYDQYYGSKKVYVAEKSLQTVSIELKRRQSPEYKMQWEEKLRKQKEQREEKQRKQKALEEEEKRKQKALEEAKERKRMELCDAITYYKAQGDGTVLAKATGLMWKQCSEGLSGSFCENGKAKQYNWNVAMDHAKRLNFAGYSDWRLPTKDELLSIVHKACGKPVINSQVFPNTVDSWYWSSSPSAASASGAWLVNFNGGYDGANNKSFNYYVRLVRGGL